MKDFNNKKGFTIVELMVTLAMSGIIVAAIYSAYTIQQKTYYTQDQIIGMQQNIRAALGLMAQEVRMAGYSTIFNPNTGSFLTATSATINFTQDITDNAGTGEDGDGDVLDVNEDIAYRLNGTTLERKEGGLAGSWQPIADNIERIEFYYTMADGSQTLTPATLSDIRAVQITILARAADRDGRYINGITYTPASGTPWDLNGADAGNAAGDNFRRRMLTTTVQCRNMGL